MDTQDEIHSRLLALMNTTLAANTSSPLVTLEGVSIRRNGRHLVENVSFSIAPAEIVTLIGPNGSGKSTTAKLVTGVLEPSTGKVSRRAGLKIGYVPQSLSVDATLPLSVKRLMNLTARHDDFAIDAALDAVGARHLKQAPVQELSGGEFQRVLLARAVIRKPDLLVLDEPVQGVDFAGQVALYDLIRSIRDMHQCGILLISHDLHVVMADTDTVICLNGHVCCTGTPDSVKNSPEYLQLFGNRAAETLAVYQHHHDHTHLPDGRVRHADGSITHDHDTHDGHHHAG